MRIEKKCWPEYFQKILDGTKNFDFRLCDFECKPNDTLVLKEWDPRTKQYTGRVVEKRVKYIFKSKDIKCYTKQDLDKYGFQIIGF